MDRHEVYQRISSVVAESSTSPIDLDSVTEETAIAGLGFDSLAILDLLFDLEEEFGIQITAEQIQGIRTVGELVTLLVRRLEASPSDAG